MHPLLSSPVKSLVGISLLVIELITVRSGSRSIGKRESGPCLAYKGGIGEARESWREGETLQERVVGGRSEPSEGLRTEV